MRTNCPKQILCRAIFQQTACFANTTKNISVSLPFNTVFKNVSYLYHCGLTVLLFFPGYPHTDIFYKNQCTDTFAADVSIWIGIS